MTLTPQDFVSKWKRAAAREKQTYQEHFLNLCRLVRNPTSIKGGPTAMRFAFEMGAVKSGGRQGWHEKILERFLSLNSERAGQKSV